MNKCSETNCPEIGKISGLCRRHYMRLWERGEHPKRKPPLPPEIRFWRKVDKTDTCWLWNGVKNKGYGSFRVGTTQRDYHIPAHRYSYELSKGKIPSGMHIDHLCRVINCVNPAHLEAVTPGENVRRGVLARPERMLCKYGHKLTKGNYTLVGQLKTSKRCSECHRIQERNRQRRLRQDEQTSRQVYPL